MEVNLKLLYIHLGNYTESNLSVLYYARKIFFEFLAIGFKTQYYL